MKNWIKKNGLDVLPILAVLAMFTLATLATLAPDGKAQGVTLGGWYVFQASGHKLGFNGVVGAAQSISGRLFVDAGVVPSYNGNLPQHSVQGFTVTGDSSPSAPARQDGGFLVERKDHSLILSLNDNRVFVIWLAEDVTGNYSQGVIQQTGPLGFTMTGTIIKSVE